MIESLQNIFRITELRNRVLFTFGILGVYRIGAFVPIPGVNVDALKAFFAANSQGVFGLVDVFTGGNFSQLTIFALGIMPYISASIILQLLAVVWPYLERLQKEGEVGRRKITQWTRYGTVILSVIQSVAICVWVTKLPASGSDPVVSNPGPMFFFLTVLTLTTGTASMNVATMDSASMNTTMNAATNEASMGAAMEEPQMSAPMMTQPPTDLVHPWQ